MRALNFFATIAIIGMLYLHPDNTPTNIACSLAMAALIALDGLCETIKNRPVLVIAAPPEPEPKPEETK